MKAEQKQNKKNKVSLVFGILMVLFALILISNIPLGVSGNTGGDNSGGAGGGVDGTGGSCTLGDWAWSGYRDVSDKLGGIGWTSFTHLNENDSTEYGVTIDENSGAMSGYVWSDSIGWIKFGGLSGFPTGSGTTAANATLGSDNEVTGWIRACSVFANGCSGSLKPASVLGGWDGWIALSGTNWGVAYDPNNNKFDGYGWGGSKVVGWFDFVDVVWNSDNCGNNGGDFEYSVLIDSLELQAPSSGSVDHPVDISRISGNPQEVSLVRVVQQGDPIPGVSLSFDVPSSGCTPDSDCMLDFNVSYNLTGSKSLIVPLLVVTESEGVEKDNSFTIAISGDDGNLVCFAEPNPAFRGQAVEWEAIPRNLPGVDRYVWSGLRIEGAQEGQLIIVPEGYDSQGVINASVQALDVDGVILSETECSLQVLPDIYFDHI